MNLASGGNVFNYLVVADVFHTRAGVEHCSKPIFGAELSFIDDAWNGLGASALTSRVGILSILLGCLSG